MKKIIGCIALLIGVAVFAATFLNPCLTRIWAEEPEEPELRGEFTFHLYVDPIHGDDDLAYNLPPNQYWYNPRGNMAPFALQDHFQGIPGQISGILQHAPYSFRTVTRAIDYINNEFAPLPWQHPGIADRRIDYIIIHCLPGLYGPFLPPQNPPDPASNLKYNGETFPIQLPERVSIQGTSALDTVFDASQIPEVNVFEIIYLGGQPPPDGGRYWTFIDSITIRGARTTGSLQFRGAGILIGGEGFLQCTISNCFITNNTIGIAILNPQMPQSSEQAHPFIINNTIAWNQVGIYSGDPGQDGPSHALPAVINNIMDSGDPYGRSPVQPIPFWGLHPNDLTAHAPAAVPPVLPQDFNAYEQQLASQHNVVPPIYNIPGWFDTWPIGTPVGIQWPYAPRVDISAYTGPPPAQRGSLYINDLFRNCPNWWQPVLGRDLSPHDFRLAPQVSTNLLLPPAALNPLVNMGIGPNVGRIEMLNDPIWNIIDETVGPAIQPFVGFPPGLPLNADDFAVYQAWDWDAEGFGNPRIAVRPPFPNPGPSDIDIGADEMGRLIMGGYMENTRIFSRIVYNDPEGSPPRNERIYFFDENINNNNHPRPEHQIVPQLFGISPNWWGHVHRNPQDVVNLYPNFNYTQGNFGSLRNSALLPPSPGPYGPPVRRSPFMTNLRCDFAPHLLLDPHSWWGDYFTGLGGAQAQDPYGANPWYNSNDVAVMDNPYLYYDLAAIRFVADGTLNPPGTFLLTNPFGYLLGPWPIPWPVPTQFGPIGYNGLPTYFINPWGFGDQNPGVPGGPDYLPNTNWQGVRYNCQVRYGQDPSFTFSNLQTFLVVEGNGEDIPLGSGARAGSYKAPIFNSPFAVPTEEELLKMQEWQKEEMRRKLELKMKQ